MTHRPPVAECRVETTCLRRNVLTVTKYPRPNTTENKTLQVEPQQSPQQPQPTRNVRQTNATQSHCCRTTKNATIGTPLTPWRTHKRQRQQQRHLHVTRKRRFEVIDVASWRAGAVAACYKLRSRNYAAYIAFVRLYTCMQIVPSKVLWVLGSSWRIGTSGLNNPMDCPIKTVHSNNCFFMSSTTDSTTPKIAVQKQVELPSSVNTTIPCESRCEHDGTCAQSHTRRQEC